MGAIRPSARLGRVSSHEALLFRPALADTADPDRAAASFERFMAGCRRGVQLFSLLQGQSRTDATLADMMGTAPRLARASSPAAAGLLDAVLDPTIARRPCRAELDRCAHRCGTTRLQDEQDILDRTRVIGSEQVFLIGVAAVGRHQRQSGRRRLCAAGRAADH